MRVTKYAAEKTNENLTELVKESAVNYAPGSDIKMDCPAEIVNLVNECFRLDKKAEEYNYMLALDTKLRLIGVFEISHGTVNCTLVTPREVYMRALLCGAVQIALVHNHPSGDTTPSAEDIKATKRISEAGKLIGIPLMDHIIIGGENTYLSLREYESDLF